ncbi:MAG: FAD-dependent oxidoreductase, partial [Oscillospiraceae bacterium]|nr:FAD-dependent oxidoreductase [Oscillospiraceae bacterium]
FIYEDTTYVPLRFLSETLGLNVGWDAESETVLLGKQAPKYNPGTYTGTAMGFGGPVSIEVTVTETEITSAKVTGEQETKDIGKAVLGALGNRAQADGLEMDGFTGATYTSRGVKDALSVALAKATGLSVGQPADGKYTIEAIGHEGIITVSTMFKDGKIMSVTINSQSETEGIGTYAIDRIPSKFVPAQSFNVDAVGGATVSSTAIKQGVAEAIIAAGGDPADFAAAPEKAEIVPTEVSEDVDVVIVGAGTAGLLAAARLLEDGVKNVLIFEKQDIPGGSMAMAFSGFNGTDSQIWKNWSLGRNVNPLMSTWDANEETGYTGVGPALYSRAVGNGSFHGDDPSLPWLKQMYQGGGKLYDWMASIGVGFYTLGVEPAYTSPYFSPGCYSGGCGYAMEFFVDRIAAQGGRIIYNTEVTELIQDENGAITGVKAVGEDGKSWTVTAKQTMLASGSFTKNKEMLEEYHPEWAKESFICPESLTGDGIRMGLEAGGVVDYAGAYMPGFLATYNSHFELAFLHYMKAGIMVNAHGDEFANILVDNHATMAKAKADPANGGKFFYVFDDAGAATIKDFDSYKFTYKGIFEKGEAVHYNSVEEAAKALNLPNLAAAIEANNGYALAGTPNAFGMAGTPYLDTTDGIWLVQVEPVVYLTTAGLRVDIDGHVLTEKDEPIANLWAAGDVIGSYEQRETRYGNGFDAAVVFGAIVGDNIAENLSK